MLPGTDTLAVMLIERGAARPDTGFEYTGDEIRHMYLSHVSMNSDT